MTKPVSSKEASEAISWCIEAGHNTGIGRQSVTKFVEKGRAGDEQ